LSLLKGPAEANGSEVRDNQEDGEETRSQQKG